MADCELLANCGFFHKYQTSLDMACRGFIKVYCKGPKKDECQRKMCRIERGVPPADEMLPTGQMMPKEFQKA
jgi:hypothetical protein